MSAGHAGGGEHGPHVLMTASRSVTLTAPSELVSAGQGGHVPVTVSVGVPELTLPHVADESTQS